ncbi:uncharacterized protein LOC126273389 [Schistocerca gregaria]|uniref:uncharacterized protein LOC126273389 n=1 Tax=Schistocerca gregaria TaxID=7010 RepID=UPI00211F43CB|nr:uncharacterized protein LOC126273389 [Schistocerca gregaria]
MTKWRIRPNPNKTQTVLFKHRHLTKKRQQDDNEIRLRLWNTPLTLSNSARYLGVYLDRHLNWKTHLNHLLNKTRLRQNLIRQVQGRFHGCSDETALHTYKTFIRPILEYAAAPLGGIQAHVAEKLYKTERRLIRSITRLPPTTPSNEVYTSYGIEPLQTRMTKLRARYGNHIIHNRPDMEDILTINARENRRPKYKYIPPSRTIAQNTLHSLHKMVTQKNRNIDGVRHKCGLRALPSDAPCRHY